MTLRTAALVAIAASGLFAAAKVWARDRSSSSALPPRSKRAKSSPSSSYPASSTDASGKRWPVPPGYRPLRAQEITPTLRATAKEMLAELANSPPGTWFAFELEGKGYGALRTKLGGTFRYFVKETPEEAAANLTPYVPLPDSLTH